MIQVYPLRDKREHDLDGACCWCDPVVDWEGPEALVIHNALDGREALEQEGIKTGKKWEMLPQ